MKTRRFMTLALCLCLGLALPAAAADMGKAEVTNVVSSGDRFTAFIDENGTLWTCGNNRYGQLGNGTYTDISQNITANTAVPVKVLDDVASVSCGNDCVAAVKLDGSLWMWGSSRGGRLGVGETGDVFLSIAPLQTVPVKVMDDVAAVSTGGSYLYGCTAAIKTDGSLWLYGCHQDGRLSMDVGERLPGRAGHRRERRIRL